MRLLDHTRCTQSTLQSLCSEQWQETAEAARRRLRTDTGADLQQRWRDGDRAAMKFSKSGRYLVYKLLQSTMHKHRTSLHALSNSFQTKEGSETSQKRGDETSQQRGEIAQQKDEISQQGDETSQRGDEISQQKDEISQQRDEISQLRDEISQQTDEISQQVSSSLVQIAPLLKIQPRIQTQSGSHGTYMVSHGTH